MSSPASGLEKLSLSDAMPARTPSIDTRRRARGPSGRSYDLASLSPEAAGLAHDGLSSQNTRLLPVLKKATYPESGFIGFEITDVSRIRIPLSDDRETTSEKVDCSCASFARLGFCSHVVWLFDGLRASLDQESTPPPISSAAEDLTEAGLLQGFRSLSEKLSLQSRGLTERINRLQPNHRPQNKTDQEIVDCFAVFDDPEDDSPRKRRRGDESLDDPRPAARRLRTCLEISPEEFFSDISPPANDIRDVVVSGDLTATIKGLARYGTLFRDSLFAVIDPQFRATDFLSRLESRLGDWKDKWETFRKDRRTTVPSTFVIDYSENLRDVVKQLKVYEDGRECPDSFYEGAVDLAISILDEILKANVDLYHGHSRQTSQARHTIPQQLRDRNVFTNLVADPPSGQTNFVRSFVEMLYQFQDENIDEPQIARLRHLSTELESVEGIQTHQLSPLATFLQQRTVRLRSQAASESSRSNSSAPSRSDRESYRSQSGQPGPRRYRELRAAPPS